MKFSSPYFKLLLYAFPSILCLTMIQCGRSSKSIETVSEQFIIRDFVPVANWHIDIAGNTSTAMNCNKSIVLDYSNAIDEGFIVPTLNQVKEGSFEFSFSIRNTGKNSQAFSYKIYYQNESYKFPERDETD